LSFFKRKVGEGDTNTSKGEGTSPGDKDTLLAVSYKAGGINTYNVFIFDLSTTLIKFWFEMYHLFEQPIMGFILESKDYCMLSKDGLQIINIGGGAARDVFDVNNEVRKIHPVGTMEHLKIEETNHILFRN